MKNLRSKESALITFLSICMCLLGVVLLARTARGSSGGDAQAAGAIYKQQCFRCHGEKGKGDGPAAKVLKPPPHDWSDKEYMKKFSDDDLYKIIAKGGPAINKSKLMPGFDGKLKENQIRDLVALVRSMTGK